MKSMIALFLLLLIIPFTISLFGQVQKTEVQEGLIGISYDDIGFKRPFKEWIMKELNSERLIWSRYNDWSLKCIGFIQAPVSGEITIEAESDNYIRFNVNGKKVIEADIFNTNGFPLVLHERC